MDRHVPTITTRTSQRLIRPRPRASAPDWSLPMELTDQILGYCYDPIDVVTFCFLHEAVLFRYIDEDLDQSSIEALRMAIDDSDPMSI
jgi:hypothetical protein